MAKTDTNVRPLENALKILNCFTREKPNLSLVEIADMVDLYPSTASRLISTMEAMGYMKRNADSLQYSLGYKLTTLGAVCLSTEDSRSVAHPYLVNLRNRYTESVGVYVLNKPQRICIDCVPSTHPLHRVI
ncbi:MAG: helix-turn-helix domain-containing protein [Lachnospiraceae bacterium]|nr:helix-turn-helix domain-containing protein [Lachnospiraceae bacterium]